MYKDKNKKRLYDIWNLMKRRCNDPKINSYERYGGRGIIVCDEWYIFNNFYKWAINNGYEDNLTIDRINTDGNYTPENCRWVDLKTQANNRCNNRLIEYNGKKQTLTQWANEYNIRVDTLKGRIDRGWAIDKALQEPINCNNSTCVTDRHLKTDVSNSISSYFNNYISLLETQNLSLRDISNKTNIPYSTLIKWKNGKSMVSYPHLKNALSLIGVSTESFLGDYESVYKNNIFSNTNFILYYIDNNNTFTMSDFNKYLNVKDPYTYIQNLKNEGYDIKIIEKNYNGNVYYYNSHW